MEQGTQVLAPGGREDRVWGPMRRRRAAADCREPPGIEGMNRMANGLLVAAHGPGDDPGVLATGAGQEDLAAAQHKGIGRLSALLKGMLFGGGEGSHIDRRFHA
jgi:hypothetical protein